jgi:hypothetical protein
MDNDNYNLETKVQKTHKHNDTDVSDILQPFGVRCSIRISDEVDRVLLDYGRFVLRYVSPIVYALFLLI